MKWLESYLKYTEHLESPTIFHQWVGIAVAGHVLGRKVWLVRGGEYCIFPGQMMVVLVSPSAIARKSTAIEAGVKLVESLPTGLANVLPTKTSPQQLLQALQPMDEEGVPIEDADCVGLIVASELGSFFSSEGFLETMATHVTALFDAKHGLIDPTTLVPEPRRVKFEFRSWAITLLNPCAGLVGGTTPMGIAEELPKAARQAGFLGRVLWIYSQDTDREPNDLTEMMPFNVSKARAGLVEGLVRMAGKQGPFRFTKQGRECFAQWYHDVNIPYLKKLDVDIVKESGYYGRRGDHLLRTAMVLAGMEDEEELLLKEKAIQVATGMLRGVEKQLNLSMHQVGVARATEYYERVMYYLSRKPEGVKRRDILRALWRYGSLKDLEEALQTLTQAGKVRTTGKLIGLVKSKGSLLKQLQEKGKA
jgi:hypothetical protein